MKAKINGIEGELLYPIVVDRPVYLLYSKDGVKIPEVDEIVEEISYICGELVTKFKSSDKIYVVEYL